MKSLLKNIFMTTFIGGVFVNPAFAVSRIEAKLENMTLQQCNQSQTKCIIVKAKKAIGSQFSSLHSLSDIQVQVLDSKNKLLKSYNSKLGYLDPQLQRIVLSEKPLSGNMKETLIDLTTLKIETKVMK